jgi:hypothetical protein
MQPAARTRLTDCLSCLLQGMWESLEVGMDLDGVEVDCDCPGPPPEFFLPPPPRPPFLQQPHCSEDVLSEFESCNLPVSIIPFYFIGRNYFAISLLES